MKKLICLCALVAYTASNAQESNLHPERSGFILRVPRNVKQTYVLQINPGRYFAQDKILQLYPHEKVWIEVEIKADTVYSMTSVKENLHPEKTLEIEFCQTVEKGTAKPTQVWIKNPFDRKLVYNSLVYSIEDSKWQSDSHTAKAKWSSNEIWRKETISSVVLKDWKFE